ncbi:MAG: hypothetical protein FWH48_09300, partial [Oscillospiraceae bacterium]|nr:hypothetical protein [Oscillospiraceae bacterium]
MDLVFFDCNLNYGPQTATQNLKRCADINSLSAELVRAGIFGGLVLKTIDEAVLANESLAEDIQGKQNLFGVWHLLPSCTGEIPSPDALPGAMKQNNIAALTINPKSHRYLPRRLALGDYFDMARARKIPILLNTARGISLEQIDDIMRDFPDLTVILTFDNCWPSDRFLRPFLDAYP